MKWRLDLGIAVALTVIVWSALYFTFPNEPLGLAETVFILALFYSLVKLAQLAKKHLASNKETEKS